LTLYSRESGPLVNFGVGFGEESRLNFHCGNECPVFLLILQVDSVSLLDEFGRTVAQFVTHDEEPFSLQKHSESGLNLDDRLKKSSETQSDFETLEQTLDFGCKPVLQGLDDIFGFYAFVRLKHENVLDNVFDQGVAV